MTRRDIDTEIRKLANNQHGAFTWKQATMLGATNGYIDRRVQGGFWIRLCHGVYGLRSSAPTWRRRLKAAQLGVPGSVVCGRSALELHDLPQGGTGLPQLVVPRGTPFSSNVARVHRSGLIDATNVDGFRASTVEQAIVEVAGDVLLAGLDHLIDHALLERKTAVPRLEARLRVIEGSRLPGIGKVRALVAERGDGFVVPESELERRLFRMLKQAGVADVEAQANPPWAPGDRRRFDALSPSWKTIFEADGRRWHARMKAIERDHARDLEAASQGYLTVRLTWTQLTVGLEEVLERVRAIGSIRSAAA